MRTDTLILLTVALLAAGVAAGLLHVARPDQNVAPSVARVQTLARSLIYATLTLCTLTLAVSAYAELAGQT